MNMVVKVNNCPLNASKDKMDFGTLLTEARSQNIKRKVEVAQQIKREFLL